MAKRREKRLPGGRTCDRVILMQHGRINFESQAAATSAAELLEVVRREYQSARAE